MRNSLFAVLATALAAFAATPRADLQRQIEIRPDDPWPRGEGHVILSIPGSREAGYHEPGGSFSPGVGSFGVSIWVLEQGKLSSGLPGWILKTTSDAIPLNQVRQQFVWTEGEPSPAIATRTPYYEAAWSHPKPGVWTLKLRRTAPVALMLAVRGAGPAAGPVNSLLWRDGRLEVNSRWKLNLTPAPKDIYMGDERMSRWITEGSEFPARVRAGWAYARVDLSNGSEWELRIEDPTPAHVFALEGAGTRAKLALDLPDSAFVESLHAQVAHLMMGVLDWQARAGDPLNYPYPWLRDGAYIVTALARAGQMEAAKKLASYFAGHDFFGGFGPEADAPGLSLWAIEETASRARDLKFDAWLWPHVRRKAEFILEMAATTAPLHRPADCPIVPAHAVRSDITLVAEPPRNGLIVGRMDHHRPLLFINAVSYRGLLSAASLAARVSRHAEAKRWRAAAARLKTAWEKGLGTAEAGNERTLISGLWPTGIAVSSKQRFEKALEDRWNKVRTSGGGFHKTPLWTYFEVATAHQWLMLGRPDRAWSTLEWFRNHQSSPGLYTWWEGEGEENSFGMWEQMRGWAAPKHVTPHYWTAAEMLLLQLDMLAAEDPEGRVIVGAGVPPGWLQTPLKVSGLTLSGGKLDWNWDGKQLRVRTYGRKASFEAGPAFGSNVSIKIE